MASVHIVSIRDRRSGETPTERGEVSRSGGECRTDRVWAVRSPEVSAITAAMEMAGAENRKGS